MKLNNSFKLIKKCICLLLCLSFCGIDAEFYSSVHEMTKLVQYEKVFLKHIQKYVAANENKLDYLKARLAELERDRDESHAEGMSYLESPLNKYLLTKRLTVDWERIENLMEHNSGRKSLNNMVRYRNNHTFPDESELNGALEGFIRVQDVYRLKTKDMAAGVLDSVRYNVELEARHCFDIAKFAATQNHKLLAHSWALEALKRLSNVTKDDGEDMPKQWVTEADVLLFLAQMKEDIGDLKGANATYAQLVELRPDVSTYTEAYAQFLDSRTEEEYGTVDTSDEHNPLPDDLFATDEHLRYKLTCNGLITQTPSEERELRCGYLTETHPFLLIAPIKVEELNHDPLLVVYYDVISDAEIAIVKKLTQNRIERAQVMGLNESMVSPVRTSQYSFLPKTAHKVLETIDVRVEDMTNLNMIFAEDHQFANYGIGGHYAQHLDWFDMAQQSHRNLVSSPEMGNRIATVLFYLTGVEQGGGTAFPYLKRLLMPKKGAAVFWHNLHASGEGDRRTNHGACPIIVGSKWVLNRWIRQFVQSDRRPCDLFDDTYHGPL